MTEESLRRFQVVIEQLFQEVVEIEAESLLDAEDKVRQGEGDIIDSTAWSPTIIESVELDGDEPALPDF